MKRLFDPLRASFLVETPEEKVRQSIVRKMLQLGYPKSLIVLEKDLSTLPHLKGRKIPNKGRRADILCFAKNIHPEYEIFPLLMIECKAKEFSEKVIRQVRGYNTVVGAHFLAIANDESIKTFWEDSRGFHTVDFLPPFQQLVNAIKK